MERADNGGGSVERAGEKEGEEPGEEPRQVCIETDVSILGGRDLELVRRNPGGLWEEEEAREGEEKRPRGEAEEGKTEDKTAAEGEK